MTTRRKFIKGAAVLPAAGLAAPALAHALHRARDGSQAGAGGGERGTAPLHRLATRGGGT